MTPPSALSASPKKQVLEKVRTRQQRKSFAKSQSANERRENRPRGIPPFHFSIFNFEDFLALHLCDADFQRWINVMSSAGHFNHPLYNADYEVQFEGFIPGYKKGNLPPDFITVASLKNLKRHIALLPHMNLNNLSVHKTFATSLIDELEQCYPNLLN